MTSPFLGFENTTLTFKIADGTYTTNAAGNRKANTIDVVIKAVLKPASYSSVNTYAQEIQQFAGADGHAMLLEGRLVNPTTYPPNLKFLSEGDAEIQLVVGMLETGRFKLLPVLQSPYVVAMGIDSITPIRGIFRRN